jgi:sodium-dependent phosphate transporter
MAEFPSFTPDVSTMMPTISSDMFDPQTVVWVVVLAFVISFLLAMAMGANDVANSFGTSVGSGVISLRQCWVMGTVFEILGATLLGARVSDTMRKGILDVSLYNGTEEVLMVGNIAGLAGSAIWQFIATYAKLPVSGTHSIIGGILGFSLVQHQLDGINWMKVGLIVFSWFLSPVLAGIVGTGCFMFVKRFILVKSNPLESGLLFLPLFYGVTCFCNVISIALSGPPLLGFHLVPLWGKFVLAFGVSLVLAALIRLVLVPFQRKGILKNLDNPKNGRRGGPLQAQFNSNQNSPSDDSKKLPSVTITASEKHQDGLNISILPIGTGFTEKKNLSRIDTSDSNRPLLSGSTAGSEVSTRNPTPVGSGAVTPQGIPIGCDAPSGIDPGLIRRKLFNKVPKESKRIVDTKNSVYLHSSLSAPIDEKSPPIDEKSRLNEQALAPNADLSSTNDVDVEAGKKESDANENFAPVDAVENVKDDVDSSEDGVDESLADLRKDSPAITELFKYLQILTACFGGFTHGGNDVSNAVGPLIAIWMIFQEGAIESKASPPMWLLMYGGLGISLGLIAFGKRVISTMGHDLTPITPSSGFTIEISSALTVLLASNVGIPISTTHCKVS